MEYLQCYKHGYFGLGPCPLEHSAWEGDREYFNHKVEGLQAQIDQLKAVVVRLNELVGKNSRMKLDLNKILAHQRPVQAPELDIPTPDPSDGFEGLRKLAREERVQRRVKRAV